MLDFIEEYTLPEKICDDLIRYYKNNKEHKSLGYVGDVTGKLNINYKKSTDVYFFNSSTNKTVCKFFNYLSQAVRDYSQKYQLKLPVKTFISNNIQHYKPGEGFPALHYERASMSSLKRELVYMLYCNTLKNGGTHFPNQETTLKAVKGKLYIWPAGFTHPHQGVICKTKEKYIVTGWFENCEK